MDSRIPIPRWAALPDGAELRGLGTKRQIARGAGLRAELERLVTAVAPWLLELPGVGPISAAQVSVSWSHAGRLRSEAAFAALADAARRTSEGRSAREIRRCLKRAVARQLLKLLERCDRPGVEVVRL